jgi:hypothetical protein
VQALLVEIASESGRRASDWVQRDRALILTSLLAGLRADELQRCNIGDVRRTDDGAVIHVRGKVAKTDGFLSRCRWSTSSRTIWTVAPSDHGEAALVCGTRSGGLAAQRPTVRRLRW